MWSGAVRACTCAGAAAQLLECRSPIVSVARARIKFATMTRLPEVRPPEAHSRRTGRGKSGRFGGNSGGNAGGPLVRASFDPFTLDAASRRLERDGAEVHLT